MTQEAYLCTDALAQCWLRKTMSEHRNIGITDLSKKVNKTWKGTSKEKKEE